MNNLEYDKLPYVSQEHLDMLRGVFKDSVRSLHKLEDLYFAKGQQSVIEFLDTVRINQEETGE